MRAEHNETPRADEVYYDGDCPMCRNLASHFGTSSESARTRFVPLQSDGVVEATGATHQALMALMHIRTSGGVILSGAEGLVYLFSRRWWGRPLAMLVLLPGAMPFARFVYGLLARNRFRISKLLVCMPWWLPILWLLISSALLVTVPTFGIIEFLFLLAPIALVPSIVGLNPARRCAPDFSIVEATPFVIASLFVAVSLAVPRGALAALLSSPWMILAVLRASRWIWNPSRILTFARKEMPLDINEAAGDLLLAIGTCWLLVSRFGYRPLGFTEPIILLTAVHFHFSGFTALGLTLTGARVLAGRNNGVPPVAVIGMLCVTIAVPLIAAGFVFSTGLKVLAVGLLFFGLLCIGLLFSAIAKGSPRRARILLIIAAVSPFLGMLLALFYVGGEYSDRELISIPTMAATHGILNGVGFCLCGLLGLLACGPNSEKQS